jgi:hypothetical protein
MVFAIITAWLAYKKANESGRNGILWALIGIGVFIGTQLIVSLGVGVLLGFGILLFGWPETIIDAYTWPITIVAIAASFGASWLLLRYLDRPLSVEDSYSPPPPPSFGDNV